MAGRGVDIKLGGTPLDDAKHEQVIKLGGLHVIGTERHESRRIDNHLRGRSGRQGDPGSSQFFVSMEDDLMRIFGSDRMKNIMDRLGIDEDTPIQNAMISKSIEGAQKKVEGHNFDIRKHLVEYDDVINKQREFIYRKRTDILKLDDEAKKAKAEESPLTPLVIEDINQELITTVGFHTDQSKKADWNIKEIIESVKSIFTLAAEETSRLQGQVNDNRDNDLVRDELTQLLIDLAREKYAALQHYMRQNFKEIFGDRNPVLEIEKSLMLRSIDFHWVNHLDTIQQLRAGIGLRGYGQRDPLLEYKREAKLLFDNMLEAIRKQVVYSIFKVTVAHRMTAPPVASQQKLQEQKNQASAFSGAEQRPEKQVIQAKPKDESGHKIGRNDPCWGGRGKKYKK